MFWKRPQNNPDPDFSKRLDSHMGHDQIKFMLTLTERIFAKNVFQMCMALKEKDQDPDPT
jgi:hypothetical protein